MMNFYVVGTSRDLSLQIIGFYLIAFLFGCNAPSLDLKSISGKTFITSQRVEGECKILPVETDVFQRIHFKNDSEFVHTDYACCGTGPEPFPGEIESVGKWNIRDAELVLLFARRNTITYSKEKPSALEGEESFETWTEKGISKRSRVVAKLNHCGETLWFEMDPGEVMAPEEADSPLIDQ